MNLIFPLITLSPPNPTGNTNNAMPQKLLITLLAIVAPVCLFKISQRVFDAFFALIFVWSIVVIVIWEICKARLGNWSANTFRRVMETAVGGPQATGILQGVMENLPSFRLSALPGLQWATRLLFDTDNPGPVPHSPAENV
ncbi:hypothetical protein BC827DRAFT_1376835 [Russula dissimulans]|nr:hypothetical protein BC827DRAFT_1376835 [Russula dissimulans]